MKNENGFTTVELIVSFALTMVVMAFLFETLLALKNLYITTSNKTELLTKQTVMSRKINGEFNKKKILNIINCGNECLTFNFTDGTSSILTINRAKKTFQYGSYRTELIEDSQFGKATVTSNTIYDVADGSPNTIIQIKIPIIYPVYKDKDYGIDVIYQYDNRITSIDEFNFES